MWGLIVAAFFGVFGSMFNIGPSAGMSRYDTAEAPTYRQEYNNSYFEDGFQANNESTTSDIVGNGSQELTDERKVSGVYIPPKEDLTTATAPGNVKEGDSLTVLSGD